MYLVEEDNEPPDDFEGGNNPATVVEEAAEVTNGSPPEISLHALARDDVPQLMRVDGQLRGRKGAMVVNQHALDVVVGDSGTLKCRSKCPQETLEIMGHKFPVELFTLAMAEADLVLGVQWLRSLGEVVWDFVGMRMHFGHTKKRASNC
ncbi:hypothetical protein EJ110_NYTH44425 [Nymphaea thermarum]|nr:hypothetical protein EJ110_NYTH44425 [Nymphaea thermarum]